MEQWKKLFLYTTLAIYLYTFLEWLFFVTTPSFLSGLNFYENMTVIFVAGGIVTVMFSLAFLILLIFYIFVQKYSFSKIIFACAVLLPSIILSALILVLIDNFTYTVFKFGIVTTTDFWRGICGIFFLYLVWVNFNWAGRFSRAALQSKLLLYAPLALVLVSSLLACEQFIHRPNQNNTELINVSLNRPNILLIGSDGVNANNMSIYGYERETTPFLDEISDKLLIAENGFANWNSSAISTTSMLTGRHPLDTQVISGSDILRGIDSYQHLPGILRSYGYFSVQMGVPAYVDAYTRNLQDAFDIVNGRTIDQNPIFQLARKLGQGNAVYFAVRIFERISDRLMHIYYFRKMTNPFRQVTLGGEEVALKDDEKIGQLINLLKTAEQPVFAHLHLMGTHGPTFSPTARMFSEKQEQTQDWMPDFYDDSILTFDGYMRKLYEELAKSGSLDNTLIIIYSDHGMAYQTQRVPVIFLFPRGDFSGKIKTNVQNLDIAPTVLDYLGISIPSWMKGYSLLNGEPPGDRLLIFGASPQVQVVLQCERVYQLFAKAHVWLDGGIKGHTKPCNTTGDIPQDVLNYFAEANQLNANELEQYPVSHLNDSSIATRASMAKLILLSMNKNWEEIPPAQGIFADVPQSDPDAPAIEYAYHLGLLEGCSDAPSLSFCPQSSITREQAAVVILRGLLGRDYVPPPATGVFVDVPITSPYAPWIEEFHRRGITSGCSLNPLKYCPESQLFTEFLRDFLERTFFPNENQSE